ncbi:hypothetical protein [Streptomyces noursei]|uniref:hypothetical protein n=1 Tax=Streptomyces noursei TaxID=1971 RepID=UPI00381F2521
MPDRLPEQIDVAGKTIHLSVAHVADRTIGTGFAKGLQFADFSSWLERKYSIHVPAPIASLTMRELQLTALASNTSTWQAFIFGTSADFMMAGTKVVLTVQFRTGGNAAAVPAAATGAEFHTEAAVTVALPSGAVIEFQGVLEYADKSGLTMSVIWSGEDVHIVDIAKTFGAGDAVAALAEFLPDEVSVELALTYQAKSASLGLCCTAEQVTVTLVSVQG